MPYTTDEIRTLIAQEARRQGVDPRVALAIARQESSLNPSLIGDNGRSVGLFQLQRAAAIDAGIDPNRRGDVHENIRGGVSYFKQQLDKERGNVERALSRYNRGTPTYKGIGDPRYVEHVMGHYTRQAENPSLLARIGRAIRPASAEAAPAGSDDRLRQIADRRQQLQQQGLPPGTAPGPAASPSGIEVNDRLRQITMRRQQLQQQGQAPGAPAPAPGPAAPPAAMPTAGPPTAAAQVEMLGQQEQGRLAAERAVGSPTVPAPTPRDLARTAAATGINILGSAGGTALGTYVAPGPGTVVGEMAGSYLARKANVALGLEEPGLGGDVASVAIPPALRGAARVATPVTKAMVRRLPGASTALHADVAERLGQAGESLRPPQPVADYYAAAGQFNPAIAPSRLYSTADDILRQEMRLQPSARNPELVRVAQDMRDLAGQGTVTLQDLEAHRVRIGEIVRDWRNRGGTGERDIRRLYGAFHRDVEQAAARRVPGAEELRTAIAASRREHAADEFADLFQVGRNGIILDPQGDVSVHGGRLATAWHRKLRDDDVFRESLTPAERNEVEGIITLAQRLERRRPPRGAHYGSGGRIGRAAIGQAVAGPVGMAIMMEAPNVIAAAMQTQRGRAAVRWALQQGGGTIDTTALNTIAQLVRQEVTAPEIPPQGSAPSP